MTEIDYLQLAKDRIAEVEGDHPIEWVNCKLRVAIADAFVALVDEMRRKSADGRGECEPTTWEWLLAEHGPQVIAEAENYNLQPESCGASYSEGESVEDSREKLEADIDKALYGASFSDDGCIPMGMAQMWLDRQEAITQAETDAYWAERDNEEIAELKSKLDYYKQAHDQMRALLDGCAVVDAKEGA